MTRAEYEALADEKPELRLGYWDLLSRGFKKLVLAVDRDFLIKQRTAEILGRTEAAPVQQKRSTQINQTELHLPDETRSLAWLTRMPCPMCHSVPHLWRLVHSGRDVHFQVRCSSDGKGGRYHCSQRPIPEEPAKSSAEAIQAWRVYLAMMKGT